MRCEEMAVPITNGFETFGGTGGGQHDWEMLLDVG